MNTILRNTAMASALAIAAMAFSDVSIAQTRKCIGDACPGQGMPNGNDQAIPNNNGDKFPTGAKLRHKNTMQPNDQVQDMQNGDDQGDNSGQMRKLRKKNIQSSDQYQDNTGQYQIAPRKRMSQSNWQFDSSRQHRRRSRDATFRFYLNGWWYPQPYWNDDYYVVDTYGYGISCRQGRNIVSERFNRVRVVECRGRTYTYLGRRHGDDFQIVLNSRSGRIIDVNEL